MKSKRKRYLRLVALLICLCCITGCSYPYSFGKQAEKKESIRVGICIYDEYDSLMVDMVSYLSAWQKELELETETTISLDVVSAGGSQLKQNDQVERFADKGYDVVCVTLVDRTDATTVIDKAKSVDMPVVFFNRELVEEDLERWDKLYYVGIDPKEAGQMQGKIVIDACRQRFEEIDKNGDGVLQYVILEGEPNHQDAIVRTQTSVSTIEAAGYKLEKLGDEIANWNRTQAKTKMGSLMERYPYQIEVIISNDDDMALGALDVLGTRSIEKRPLIVGVDGMAEALEMVKNKYMEGTVYNDANGQAEAIMKLAYALAMEEKIPDEVHIKNEKYVILPHQIINYGNVQRFITKNTGK